MTIVIGLISGTSVDGIDAVIVEIAGLDVDLKVELLAGATYPYPDALRKQILEVCGGAPLSMAEFAELDDAIARAFARAALAIQTGYPQALLIGSHGQTVYHRPPNRLGTAKQNDADRSSSSPQKISGTAKSLQTGESPPPADLGNAETGRRKDGETGGAVFPIPNSQFPIGYSLQLGRGALIAQLTGIPTVTNFRAADIAVGGQGAPLVSKIDVCLLGQGGKSRCIQNIGGIGNVTYIPAQAENNWEARVCGWDTGPGNTLLDLAVQHFTGGAKTYDKDGSWAATGTPCHFLLEQWLQQDYFQQPPPKSTGRELFGSAYLQQCLTDAKNCGVNEADLLATLTQLTAASIVSDYRKFLPEMPNQVLLCGGGSRNVYLKSRLQAMLPVSVLTTDEVGLNADYKEAIAFAVLAYWRSKGIPGNLPQVTGASSAVLLGDLNI